MVKKPFRGITDVAAWAIKELVHVDYVVRDLAARVKFDEKCMEERNARKASLKPITNKLFNDAVFYFIGKSALCDAVDIYNHYCQNVLHLAVVNNPAAVPLALTSAKRFGDKIKKATKNQTDPAQAVLNMFQAGYIADRYTREAIHIHLDVEQFPETELTCLCRNILIHKRGIDIDGEIPAKLKEIGSRRAFIGAQMFPDGHLPIRIDPSMRVFVDDQVGLWAVGLLQQQIHSMDQRLSFAYRLPTSPTPKLSIGRTYVTDEM